ncbi:MAG: redoxin domain-containing protein [Planctomycetales bacterium]|nr:redoxin domain-containing protein [Planctomycetales bacterium]MCA9166731.1 redoxin domain-containing protein [Planctomycetales bacterium]
MQLRQAQLELSRRAVEVFVVTFETRARATAYVQDMGLTWPLLIDEQRLLFRSFGMEHGTHREILGWASWLVYFRLFWRGRKMQRPTGDVYQLGGDVLIDPTGVVQHIHVGRGPADRPTVDEILTWIDNAPTGGA